MVPLDALSTPKYHEGVPSPGGQREVEHGESNIFIDNIIKERFLESD